MLWAAVVLVVFACPMSHVPCPSSKSKELSNHCITTTTTTMQRPSSIVSPSKKTGRNPTPNSSQEYVQWPMAHTKKEDPLLE